MNPIACIIDFLVNNPECRRYINVTERAIDSDELTINYNVFKESYDYCEEEL